MAFMGQQEAWKVGLPAQALTKIESLESSIEKMNKERVMKQSHIENLEQALLVKQKKVILLSYQVSRTPGLLCISLLVERQDFVSFQ